MGATYDLSQFVAELEHSAIPDDVVHQAKRCLIDWLGVTLAGSRDPSTAILLAAIDRLGPGDDATVLGRGRRAALLPATLVNGFMAHVLDFDDTYNPERTTVHGSAPVWPAIVALSERRSLDGRAALTAFVAGFETEIRVALAAGPAHYEVGWHVTGTAGHLGAAAAAAAVLGLGGPEVAHALGAAGTQAAGLKGVYGSMGKALHPGKAAMDGLLAALLAGEGFTASTAIIEGKHGFLEVLSPDPDPDLVTQGLGDRWMLRDNGFKPYACGSLTHPTIEAITLLRQDTGFAPEDVVSIEAVVNDYVSWVTAKPEPTTGLEAKFSIYHCAAVAAIDGAASVRHFADERVNDPALVDVRRRVRITVDNSLPKDAASVTIALTNGRRLTRRVLHNKGTPAKPMTDDEIAAKFVELAEPVIDAGGAKEALAACWALEDLEDVSALAGLCRGGGVGS